LVLEAAVFYRNELNSCRRVDDTSLYIQKMAQDRAYWWLLYGAPGRCV